MSGGVDSSVAAALLKEEGWETIGVGMQLWDYAEAKDAFGSCCSPFDVMDARAVAAKLRIPYYLQNFQDAFRRQVVDTFIAEYQAGRTPSPCVLCNQRFKFDHLLRRADELGSGRVATGHYARVIRREDEGRHALYRLYRGRDREKDQSYFLFSLNQKQLARATFPVGHLTKGEVRERARSLGLKTADKAESQDICFVTGGDYADFIQRQTDDDFQPGDIVDSFGRVLGRHAGLPRYTVGQRKGLGISAARPLYVLRIDAPGNRLVVGHEEDLGRREFTISQVNWIIRPQGEASREGVPAGVQIRHRHTPKPARVFPLPQGRARVTYTEPERGVAPGQAAVFYRDDEVLGGGWI
ncbi:MAG: tRNA 2-thiouridine(34) synthase MnmA, partial [Nitrospinota bacterium]